MGIWPYIIEDSNLEQKFGLNYNPYLEPHERMTAGSNLVAGTS